MVGRVGVSRVGCVLVAACVVVLAIAASASASASALASARGWTVQPTPPWSGNMSFQSGSFNAISCASTTSCVADGQYSPLSEAQPVADSWDGTTWSVLPFGTEFGEVNPFLGVSCFAPGHCMVIGYLATRGQGTFATAFLVGDPGADATPPVLSAQPASGYSDSLFAVSCTASGQCTAIGTHSGSDYPPTLIERWNGTAWSLQTAAARPGGGTPVLGDVSCASETSCMAVGGDDLGTLAESWDGTQWSIVNSPNPPGSWTQAGFNNVSCPSPVDCTVVGAAVNAGTVHPFAARLRYGRWGLMDMPVPSGAAQTFITGLSCADPRDCTAVGSFVDASGTTHSVAEREVWGHWVLQDMPVVSTLGESLTSVSCPSPRLCLAAGNWTGPADLPEFGESSNSLVEQWVAPGFDRRDHRRYGGGWGHGRGRRRDR